MACIVGSCGWLDDSVALTHANENIIMISGRAKVEVSGRKTSGPETIISIPPDTRLNYVRDRLHVLKRGWPAFDIHYVDEHGKEIAPEQALKPANK
jgi:hypothetical protein